MDNKILQSVIEITKQRDLDSLEYSLVATVAELVPVTEISVLKVIHDNNPSNLDISVQLRAETDEYGDTNYSWSDNSNIIIADDEIQQCLNSATLSVHHTSDGGTRLLSPIDCEGKIIGIVSLQSKQDITPFKTLIDGLLRIYNNYTVIFNESERDKLTGLYNRRTFDNKLQRLFQAHKLRQEKYLEAQHMTERRTKQDDAFVWLVIFDIDHFKRVNDEYGHVFGDEVILTISQKLKENFRNNDLKFRVGGEEFVIILEPATFEQATELLEKFRANIEGHSFPQVGTVSISIGFAKITDRDFPPVILERADRALYYGKEHGRNCVHNYEKLVAEGEIKPPKRTGSVDLF